MPNRIKEFRNKNGLTQRECVKSFNNFLKENNVKGITTATFSRWENSLNSPTEKMWNLLSDFFKVPVLYLQGKILSKEQIEEKLIPKIHQFYFDTWLIINNNRVRKSGAFSYSPEFVDNVNAYITLKNGDSKLPPELYSDTETEYKLSDGIRDYWRKNFDSIFDEITSEEISSYTNTFFLFDEFNKILKKKRNELVHNGSDSLTALGFFYKNEFDNEDFSENRMHDNMRIMLMHAKYETAKKSINEYADLIIKLREEVNSFNEDEYFMYRLDNIVMPIQNPFNANLIMNEAYKRIHDGDTDLLHYIMANDGLGLTGVYYRYKKSKHEDVEYLYELEKRDKERNKLLKDDGFRSYLSKNYDFSKPNKFYNIEALYEKYKQNLNSK